jgi:hypothetical protein
MIEVKSRSVETWGILANADDKMFNAIINERREPTKNHIKVYEKRQKKLKPYKVSFIKEMSSDEFEIMAESEYDVSNAARQFFKENKDNIDFKMKPASKWAGDDGYDRLRYVRVRT